MPKANEPRALWPILLIVFVALAAGGCSTSTTNSGLSLVDEQGNHPAGWIASHPRFALPDGSICVSCHGSVTSAAESGGISGVSCFLASRNGQGCHAGGPGAVPHPVGGSWVTTPPAAQPHGNAAKAAPGATTGFAYCQICHGANGDFAGGLSEVPCYTCHGASAPHPSSWLPGATYVHTSTAEGNASLCGFCHYGESTGGNHAPTPPPAGSGCFNNTLCHGSVVPHPVDNTWVTTPPAAQPHGNAAKAAPGATTGFAYCQICHGANGDFAGGLSEVPCYTCHGASAPHPSSWLPGATYVHTSTAEGNASLCGFCHYGESTGGNHAPTPPPAGSGCFNNTLCHGSVVPAGTHTTGWLDRDTPAAFHGTFVGQITCETAACHPISGHPTCTSCHFDNQGSRANASLNPSFAHDASVFTNHMNGSYSSVGNVCENCHQTSRTFRTGAPPSSCGPTGGHPNNQGCHYDASLLDPVLTNPNF